MTANAHTPGPWQAIKLSKYRTSIDTLDMTPVCNLEEATPADARLIAAAPDMLAALEHILNIEGACFAADESWNVEWHFDKVRTAITKARGIR